MKSSVSFHFNDIFADLLHKKLDVHTFIGMIHIREAKICLKPFSALQFYHVGLFGFAAVKDLILF